jgi:ribosomal protein L15
MPEEEEEEEEEEERGGEGEEEGGGEEGGRGEGGGEEEEGSSVVWPHMLFGPYQCVYGALFGISLISNNNNKKWLAVNGLNQRLLFYSLSCFKHSSFICLHYSLSCKNTYLV